MPNQLGGQNNFINVSRGLIPGSARSQRTGFNPGVGTGETTIWNETTTPLAYPASTAAITVSSSSANDTAAGTGARTVTLSGLSDSFAVISETIILNGQTAVTSVNAYKRVTSLTTATAGSGGKNAGVIYAGTGVVTAGVPATIYTSMGVGYNASRQAFTTIPIGTTGYIMDVSATSDTAGVQIILYTRTPGGLFQATRINQVGVSGFQRVNILPLALTAGTDVEYRALVATGTAKVSCQLEMIYIQPN